MRGDTVLDKETFAGNLRAFRARKHVRQDQVAEAIGCDASTIVNYELAKSTPNIIVCWKLADYYGCSLDDLAGRPWPPAQEG